jgi:hypothetical protein
MRVSGWYENDTSFKYSGMVKGKYTNTFESEGRNERREDTEEARCLILKRVFQLNDV